MNKIEFTKVQPVTPSYKMIPRYWQACSIMHLFKQQQKATDIPSLAQAIKEKWLIEKHCFCLKALPVILTDIH